MDVEQFLEKGDDAFFLGSYERAIDYYKKIIDLDKNNTVAYINQGNAYQKLGHYELAESCYSKALSIELSAIAYYNRGMVLRKLNRIKEAVENFSEAIKIEPYLPHIYVSRGNTKRDLGLLEEAVLDYGYALFLKPDCIEAYYNRGISYKQLGKELESANDLMRAKELESAESY